MSRLSLRAGFSKAGSCRSHMTSSRGRRDALAETLDKKWSELRRYASIEKDSAKMLRLTTEREEHRQRPEVAAQHGDDC